MAWPNAPPQDNCHRLSLKCRYKALCFITASLLTHKLCLGPEHRAVNNNLCSSSRRKSSTKHRISQLRKISHFQTRSYSCTLEEEQNRFLRFVTLISRLVSQVLLDTCLFEPCHPETISSWREVHNQNAKQNIFICYQ